MPRHLLFKVLAYQRQAEIFGDLDKETKKLLERIANGENSDNAKSIMLRRRRLRPGTILVREWNGTTQRVAVLEDGFSWSGKTFRSLSEVARAITGTRWSGPRFFGVREEHGQP
jgi:hypothetical protein